MAEGGPTATADDVRVRAFVDFGISSSKCSECTGASSASLGRSSGHDSRGGQGNCSSKRISVAAFATRACTSISHTILEAQRARRVQVDGPPEHGTELVLKVSEREPWHVPRLKLHEHVHIAPRIEPAIVCTPAELTEERI